MNEQPQIATEDAPRPRPSIFVDLPLREGEIIVSVQPYRVEGTKPRKWQFWVKEKVKVKFGVLTSASRFFILDPDAVTVEEKVNNY